ncbi:MAG: hypothetical protein V3T28_10755 [Gemmatimonadales bacterium]
MKQYQVVIAKLQGRSQSDEETLTDLLNERERTGWHFYSQTALSPSKLMLVFVRET